MDYRQRWELKEYRFEQRFHWRTTVLHGVLVLLLLTYLGMFGWLQVAQGAAWAEKAEANRLRKIPILPNRGVVYDRRHEVLASTRPSLNLVLRREGLTDADGQLQRIEALLGIPYTELRARLDKMKGRPSFESMMIRQDASLDELAKVEARREWFPSVEIEEVTRRNYAEGAAVAHVLGYVAEVSEKQLSDQGKGGELERGDIVGKTGIEQKFDETLRGRRGWKFVTVNNLGRPFGDAETGRDPTDGTALQVTLDGRLQRTLYEAFEGETGAGVFMDPWTGEVLALVSAPAYDPNVFAGGIDAASWQSLEKDPRKPMNPRPIANFYAPGSTFKVVMAVAGLESGVISPGTTMYCGGSAVFYGRPFLCWKKGGHGTVDLRAALTHSCNVYFYNVGQRAGIDAIAKWGDLLNLGRPTGIDLPGEKSGTLPSPAWKAKRYAGTGNAKWFAGETISVAIGQGLVSATPLQMATMISGIATGAVPYPHVLQRNKRAPRKLPAHPGTLEAIRQALADVVEEGTGKKAQLGPIRVAGKTGTAQVYKHSAGIDADKLDKAERDHAWFVGFAPAEKPEIAFAVMVEHGGHGGTTAAPIVRKVLEVYFEDRLPRKDAREPAGQLQARAEAVVGGTSTTR
ncbi:MAG TPA: penicillin-binding protein 2 [Candidatus Polarisedimenticolaceae bacterium]|nr:penicillin-binding protein 2 [Candidatus Polarisedimenticolaceae bacterium]